MHRSVSRGSTWAGFWRKQRLACERVPAGSPGPLLPDPGSEPDGRPGSVPCGSSTCCVPWARAALCSAPFHAWWDGTEKAAEVTSLCVTAPSHPGASEGQVPASPQVCFCSAQHWAWMMTGRKLSPLCPRAWHGSSWSLRAAEVLAAEDACGGGGVGTGLSSCVPPGGPDGVEPTGGQKSRPGAWEGLSSLSA